MPSLNTGWLASTTSFGPKVLIVADQLAIDGRAGMGSLILPMSHSCHTQSQLDTFLAHPRFGRVWVQVLLKSEL